MSRARRRSAVPPVAIPATSRAKPSDSAAAPTVPTANSWLRGAAALVALEGVGLIVVALLYAASVRDEGHGLSAWGAAVTGVAVGAVLVAVLARGLARGSRSVIAPTLLAQLIGIGEAYNMTKEQKWTSAVIVGVLALAALAATVLGVRQMPADDD